VPSKKILLISLVLLVLFVSLTVCGGAYSVKIDGRIDPLEWADSQEFPIVNRGDKSNCGVTFTYLNLLIDDDSNRIYLAFTTELDEFHAGHEGFGYELYINGGERIASFYDSGENEYDREKYSLEAAYLLNPNHNQFYAEMYVGVLFGLPESVVVRVGIYDCCGEPSNRYDVVARVPAYRAAEERTTAEKSTTQKATAATITAKSTTATTTLTRPIPASQDFTTVPYVPYAYPTAPSGTTAAALTAHSKTEHTSAHKETVSATMEAAQTEVFPENFAADSTEAASQEDNSPILAMVTFASDSDGGRAVGVKKAAGVATASVLLLCAVLGSAYLGFAPKKKTGGQESEEIK